MISTQIIDTLHLLPRKDVYLQPILLSTVDEDILMHV